MVGDRNGGPGGLNATDERIGGSDPAADSAADRAAIDALAARLPRARAGSATEGARQTHPPLRSAREFWNAEGVVADAGQQASVRAPGASRSAHSAAASVDPAIAEPGVAEPAERRGVFFTRPGTPRGIPDDIDPSSLPRRRNRKSLGRRIWFGVSFVAPVILGGIYLFALAPDQYTTEFRFSVRVPVGQPGSMASGGASLSALFGGNPTPGTDLLDNFTVADYVRSQQAAVDLDKKVNLKAMYNKPADPFSRVGDGASAERLARYWKKMVFSDYDVTTGLAVVRVKAYTAKDSYTVANTLMQQANDLVNQIGQQSQQDTVRFAKQQVERATQQVSDLRREISSLSTQRRGIEAAGLTFRTNTDLAVNTRNNIAQLQSQIQVLMAQLHNPDAPQIRALREQLAANERTLAASIDVANAPQTNRYADLMAQLPATLQVLSNAQAAYSNARAMSDAQRLYLTTYVKPRVGESPTGPDRLADFILLTVIAGMVWLIGLLLRNSVMEHGR